MSTNANLRRAIKALCAPAVMAMMAGHVQVAQADITANSASFLYLSQGASGAATFTLNVLDQQADTGDTTGPLVDGSPRPLQLVKVELDSEFSTNATVTTSHNCITVMVPPSFNQSGSSTIGIVYTVSDGDRFSPQQAQGEILFRPSEVNTFTPATGSHCADPQFKSSTAVADSASTPANTPVDINVLQNDTLSYDGAVLHVSGVHPGAQVSINNSNSSTPTLTYTPAPGFSGADTFQYTIQDYTQSGFHDLNPTATVTVNVAAPPPANQAIIAFNGKPVPDESTLPIADKDGVAGESVTFDGSHSLFFGQTPATRYQWFVGNSDTAAQDDKSPTFTTKLPDGNSQIRLVAFLEGDGTALSASTLINVTVAAAVATTPSQAKIVINGTTLTNGGTFSFSDTDGAPGEKPTFDGSQSVLAGGVQPTNFQWFVNGTSQQNGTSATFAPKLVDGTSRIRLIASNGDVNATADVDVTVAGVTTLANIPGLTKNQRQVAQALDNICRQLEQNFAQNQSSLTTDQNDLRQRCEGILADNQGDQRRALDELGATDFNGARLQTLLFTNSLYAGVQDRLMALRGGAKGLSLAGLNVIIDGKPVPLAELEQMFGKMLGSGASADDEPGSLLGDKWGAWSRGNFTFGSKDGTKNDKGFDADQYSLTAGLDYRLSDKAVIGGALAYGSSNLDYSPHGEGGLDTTSWAVSIYGSRYAGKNFYFDALVNAANSSYQSDREISYNEVVNGVRGAVVRQAKGDTDGFTLSGGLSGGYDFTLKGLTLSPNVGVFYVDSSIDKFREKRSGGLNLLYDQQSFQSLTGTFGFRADYAWSLSWGVLLPYVRADYVREFNKNVEAFNVHFVNDPKNPANTIAVQSDEPDESYVRLVGGISGQFPFGISGYIEYQRLEGFQFVNFNDLAAGLRVQYRY